MHLTDCRGRWLHCTPPTGVCAMQRSSSGPIIIERRRFRIRKSFVCSDLRIRLLIAQDCTRSCAMNIADALCAMICRGKASRILHGATIVITPPAATVCPDGTTTTTGTFRKIVTTGPSRTIGGQRLTGPVFPEIFKRHKNCAGLAPFHYIQDGVIRQRGNGTKKPAVKAGSLRLVVGRS